MGRAWGWVPEDGQLVSCPLAGDPAPSLGSPAAALPHPPPPTPCNWPSSCMCVHHLLAKGSVPGNWTHMSALPLGPWLTVFYLACLDCHAPGPDPWQISFFPFGRCPLSLPLHRDSTPTVNPRVSSSERYGPSLEKHLLEVTGKF